MDAKITKNQIGKRVLPSGVISLLFTFLFIVPGGSVYGFIGTEVFQGFTGHISQQINSDKQDFYAAQVCTTWFYKNMKKPPERTIEKISFPPTYLDQDTTDFDCSNQYPNGLEAARKAFSQTQQALSISLTFYQFALVGDADDDGQYNDGELKDVLESFGLNFQDRLPSYQYILVLNGMFDSVRGKGELQTLMDGMGTLYDKGYRFSNADQVALNQEVE